MKSYIEDQIEKGVSRRALAKRGDVSLGTIQNILLGDTETKNSTLEKMSRRFGIPFQQTLKVTQTPDSTLHPSSMTAYDLLIKALMDRIEAQGRVLQSMQDSITALNQRLTDITAGLGDEIGEIKTRMIDTAKSGDYHRLDPTRHFRN